MSLKHTNTQVTTVPGVIVQIPIGVEAVATQIYNNTGAAIYLGDATIATSGANVGNALANGASVQVWLKAGDALYAVCASSPSGYVSVIYSA
jgi:hypothetical protein